MEDEKARIARKVLKILEITYEGDPCKRLRELDFPVMSSIGFDILRIIGEINQLLERGRLEEAEAKLPELEDTYGFYKYWD
jgi:soluble cytochrome b562